MVDTYRITPNEQDEHERKALFSKIKGGAYWFYLIAALSVVNSLIVLYQGGWKFAVGLGVTSYADFLSLGWVLAGYPSFVGYFGFIVTIVFSVLFIAIGYSASKGKVSPFTLGIAIYSLDGALCYVVGSWVSVGFHIFALFFILRGFVASLKLR